ncbi:protein FAR1-RELATED SEQUENCE 5-like [Arachis ipaensis]|uniref:protein FAR1-RELATED SEQUENCE 5-like n=1 Tax=Arachis ipaensis TaxID=130454 RepID=UPI000A2AF44D|nr:protein FAR1-RELATED SEQUENCE 5-like [Arachis ipaensis]
MDDSTSDCQLNQGKVDFEFESNEVLEPLYVVNDQFVPKVGMTFNTLEDAAKFYKDYAKAVSFSTRVRSTNKKGKWKSKISLTEKANPTAGLNCPARIYIHVLKDVGVWIILKVVLHHSHPYCPDQAQMLKQHRELSMSVCRAIENNEEASIRPSKTFQSFVAAAGGHCELNFIEKDVRSYITKLMLFYESAPEVYFESKELTAILHRAYDNVMVEIEELKAKWKGTCSLSHEDANLESVNELQSPPRI